MILYRINIYFISTVPVEILRIAIDFREIKLKIEY